MEGVLSGWKLECPLVSRSSGGNSLDARSFFLFLEGRKNSNREEGLTL